MATTDNQLSAYDQLETHATDNEFCRVILNFLVNHPLEKYSKVRLLSIQDALKELNEVAKQLTDVSKLLHNNENERFEFDKVLSVFLVHIACIFSRIMVEILICLSFAIEPHIKFWDEQYRLNSDSKRHLLGRPYAHLCKIYTLSISSRRARIFKKLLSDLHIQTGHIQWWLWTFLKLKQSQSQHTSVNSIAQFLSEMTDLFEQDAKHKEKENNVDAMIEAISFADSFVIKMQKDIAIWGMPSHWTKNYKIYTVCTASIAFTSMLSYYKWPQIVSVTRDSLSIISNFFIEHCYEPIDEILRDIFYFNRSKHERELNYQSYEIEKASLKDMIKSFEENQLHISNSSNSENLNMELVMDAYKKDIQSPISSATKGSLLTNIFIQIQKMKVEISKLLIDVDNIMDSNKINMEIFATVPFIAFFYIVQQLYFRMTSSGNKIKTRHSKKELRFIFRSIYSILVKNYHDNYLDYEQSGIILFLFYKCYAWAKRNAKDAIISNDELQWIKYDINHFINKEYSVTQQLELLKRMELYYL